MASPPGRQARATDTSLVVVTPPRSIVKRTVRFISAVSSQNKTDPSYAVVSSCPFSTVGMVETVWRRARAVILGRAGVSVGIFSEETLAGMARHFGPIRPEPIDAQDGV